MFSFTLSTCLYTLLIIYLSLPSKQQGSGSQTFKVVQVFHPLNGSLEGILNSLSFVLLVAILMHTLNTSINCFLSHVVKVLKIKPTNIWHDSVI